MKTKTLKPVVGSPIPALNVRGCTIYVSRAYEIATLGNHSITLAYYRSINGDYDRDVNPKDCAIIEQVYGFKSVLNGDIILEVIRPQFDELTNSRGVESFESIQERIEQARQRPEVTEVEKLDVCNQLLKTAHDRLNFGIYDLQTVWEVAATIARLDGGRLIRIEHIAEAIQYRSIIKDETAKFYEN